jgi:outer membrane protein OmpA-like peptidoglycan-associated protein
LPQTIDFHPADAVLGLTPGYELEATASSGLPVTLDVTSSACTLDGTTLTAPAAGACIVTATQSGSDGYLPAAPVSAVVKLVLPVDDIASTPGATAVLVDVLHNDPADVALDQVSPPAHGDVVVVDGQVRYTPGPAFRGADAFTYTVTRDGRSAEASVTVTVDNQAPTLAGARLTQSAGTEATVLLDPLDPNGDPVTLDAVSGTGTVEASVTGHELTVTAGPAASGDVDITVTATDSEGASTEAIVTTRITPLAPTHVRRTLSDVGTTVRWRPAPTAGAVYQTFLDGEILCRSARPVCTSSRLAGPRAHVSVRTLGRDATRSPRVDAPLVGHGRILLATIYFRTGSARLTHVDQAVLTLAIRAIRQDGFGRVRLDGYTDSAGGRVFNRALSRRRTHAVAGYLHDQGDIGSRRAWHGETDPAAPNDSRGGKSKNRRVEVVLTY